MNLFIPSNCQYTAYSIQALSFVRWSAILTCLTR